MHMVPALLQFKSGLSVHDLSLTEGAKDFWVGEVLLWRRESLLVGQRKELGQ